MDFIVLIRNLYFLSYRIIALAYQLLDVCRYSAETNAFFIISTDLRKLNEIAQYSNAHNPAPKTAINKEENNVPMSNAINAEGIPVAPKINNIAPSKREIKIPAKRTEMVASSNIPYMQEAQSNQWQQI